MSLPIELLPLLVCSVVDDGVRLWPASVVEPRGQIVELLLRDVDGEGLRVEAVGRSCSRGHGVEMAEEQ